MKPLRNYEFHFRCKCCKSNDNFTIGEEIEEFTSRSSLLMPQARKYSNEYEFYIRKPIFRCRSCGNIIPYTEEMQRAYNVMVGNMILHNTVAANPFRISWLVHDDRLREKTGDNRMICISSQTEGMLTEQELKDEFLDMIWGIILDFSSNNQSVEEIDDKLVAFTRYLLYYMEKENCYSGLSPHYKLIPQPHPEDMVRAKRSGSKYHTKDDINILTHDLWQRFLEKDPRKD